MLRTPSSARRALPLALSLSALSTLASAQGSLLVVDDEPGPGVDFTSLADAVGAAQEGDTVLIRAGVYDDLAGIAILGKSVALVAEAGASPVVRGTGLLQTPLSISGLAAGQEVVVRGLTFEFSDVAAPSAFVGNQGRVRIEDCRFLAPRTAEVGLRLLHVVQNDSFVMTRTEVAWGRAGRPAIQVEGSSFSAYDVRVTAGSRATGGIPTHGGDAILALDSHLFLSGTRLIGGDAQDGGFAAGACQDGGDGGDALVATSCDVVLRGAMLSGGAPGLPADSACAIGAPGEALALAGGTLVVDADAPPRIDASSPVVEGHFARLTFDAPGALAFALVSNQSLTAPAGPLGELLVAAPVVLAFDGAIPAHGKTVMVPIGPLYDLQARTVHVQGAVLDPAAGKVELTNATAVTVLADGL